MNNSLIFDVGMHTGRDTEFYLKKGVKEPLKNSSE